MEEDFSLINKNDFVMDMKDELAEMEDFDEQYDVLSQEENA